MEKNTCQFAIPSANSICKINRLVSLCSLETSPIVFRHNSQFLNPLQTWRGAGVRLKSYSFPICSQLKNKTDTNNESQVTGYRLRVTPHKHLRESQNSVQLNKH
jgi:hypothetical protein